MAGEQDRPATRLVVNRAEFLERATALGFQNIEQIAEKARQEGKAIGASTIYTILANGNYTRDSIERLCEVTGISLEVFVSFEPATESLRRD